MKNIFYNLLISIFFFSSAFSMDDPTGKSFAKENSSFLQKLGERTSKNTYLSSLQILATGLLVQARLMELIPPLIKDTQKIEEANQQMYRLTEVEFFKEEGPQSNCRTFYIMNYEPQTKEGLQVYIKHRKLLLSNYVPNHEIATIVSLLRHPQTSEPYRYGLFMKAKLDIQRAQIEHNKNTRLVEERYRHIIQEHRNQYLVLTDGFEHNPVREKFKYMLMSVSGQTDYVDDYAQYQPQHQALNDLYQQGIRKILGLSHSAKARSNTKKKNPLAKYTKTLESIPTSFLESLDNPHASWLDDLKLHAPIAQPKKINKKPTQQKKEPSVSKSQTTEQYITSDKKSQNAPTKKEAQTKNCPPLVTLQPQQEVASRRYAADGSYTDLTQSTDNEIVVLCPQAKTECHLYALDAQDCPVQFDVTSLTATQNIQDWMTNPQQALETQGYFDPQHKNYTDKKSHARIIAIHRLPEEIKKHTLKFAQQTSIKSRIHSGDDIQITFCGELHLPDGSKETGLFIYLIDSRTLKIFHQLFTTQSYGNLYDSFKENGNFKNVFFPSLEWAYQNKSNT